MQRLRFVVTLFSLAFAIFLFSFSVSAVYQQNGDLENTYRGGTGFFNEDLDFSVTEDINSRPMNDVIDIPLVYDLDTDGMPEIIINDQGAIKLYNDYTLDIIDGYVLPTSTSWSNMGVYVLDEIPYINIYDGDNDIMYFLSYNGTNFYNVSSYHVTGLNRDPSTPGDTMIRCGTDNCLLLSSESDLSAASTTYSVDMVGYNLSGHGSASILTNPTIQHVACFPSIPSISYEDYDDDGTSEFIASYFITKTTGTGTEQLYIVYITVNSALTALNEQTITETITLSPPTGASLTCKTQGADKWFTSPLVYELDGFSSTGLETVVGMVKDSDEFIMRSYDKTGSQISRHPDLYDADGILISNVVLANVYSDTGVSDFCVMGYHESEIEIDILCSSLQTGGQDDREFVADVDILDYISLNQVENIKRNSIHAAQHSSDTYLGNNLDEIVTSYGIYEFDWETQYGISIPARYTFNQIFENPIINSSLLSNDMQGTGRDDLIAATDTNIWYLDDGYVNEQGYINDYIINPCIDAAWKVNTSVAIQITPVDDDGDTVSARVILYYGDSNAQDSGWSENVSSGTTLAFTDFNVNKTVPLSKIRLMATDTENYLINPDIIDLNFGVGLDGVEFGDCTTAVSDLGEGEEEESYITTNSTYTVDDNELLYTIVDFANISGLPPILFIILIILGVDLIILLALHYYPTLAIGGILLFDIGVIIVVAMMGFIGTSLIITLFALIIIAGGFWATQQWNKISGGGNGAT